MGPTVEGLRAGWAGVRVENLYRILQKSRLTWLE